MRLLDAYISLAEVGAHKGGDIQVFTDDEQFKDGNMYPSTAQRITCNQKFRVIPFLPLPIPSVAIGRLAAISFAQNSNTA